MRDVVNMGAKAWALVGAGVASAYLALDALNWMRSGRFTGWSLVGVVVAAVYFGLPAAMLAMLTRGDVKRLSRVVWMGALSVGVVVGVVDGIPT